MIQQSQNYFAAAVSAALINTAAIAAFVLITLISSTQGFLLKDVLGTIGSITPSSQVDDSAGSTGSASRDGLLRSGAFSVTRSGSDRAAAAGGESTSSDAATGRGSVHQSHANSLSGPAGGTSGSGGSTSGTSSPGSSGSDPLGSDGPLGGGGPLGSDGSLGGGGPGLPDSPVTIPSPANPLPTLGSGSQDIGSSAIGATSAVEGSANGLLGSGLSSGGAASTATGAGSALLGSGSASGTAVSGISGAVKGSGAKLPGLG